MTAAQAEGCGPIAAAYHAQTETVVPVIPSTVAKSLAIGNPADGPYVLDIARRTGGDRKSTRLNSSHVEISYAVFCLKKKTERHAGAALRQPPCGLTDHAGTPAEYRHRVSARLERRQCKRCLRSPR